MSSRSKLVLLADRLDRRGLIKDAAIVDETIERSTFDEGTRGDIADLVPEMQRMLVELEEAVESGILEADGVSLSGALEGEHKEFFQDKINRLQEMTEYVDELNGMMQGQWAEPEGSQEQGDEDSEGASGDREQGPSQSENSEGNEWWKFWKKDDATKGQDGPDESFKPEGHLPEEAPPEEELEEVEPSEEDEDGGDRFQRTRTPGVNVEQSISNVGNVTIGE